MADERGPALDFIGIQKSANGGSNIAPKFLASPFLPAGYGLVFTDSNGAFWLLRLKLNTNGTTFFDDNSQPTLEAVQITLP